MKKPNKYNIKFTIIPDKDKVTLGYNNFDEIIREKLRWFEINYGKIEGLEIVKEGGEYD